MASRFHDDRKRDLSHLGEEFRPDIPKKRISPSSSENMRKMPFTVDFTGTLSPSSPSAEQDKKSTQEKSLSHKHRTSVGRAVSGLTKACKVIHCKRRSSHPFLNSGSRKRPLPGFGDCDMANKENELAFAGNLQDKILKDSRTYLLNSSDSGSSQTDGPSSKFSSFFAEVSSDHETMAQVLFSRNLRLSVALTFWRRQSVCELVAYLLRIQDLGVLVDCLPMLTNSIQEEKPHISPGCCVDLLPLVTSLIKSRFEEYVLVGLNWLQAVIKRWWLELSGKQGNHEDGNILILRHQLKGLWQHGSQLSLLPGYTGNLAKDVEVYISQLH